MEKVCLKCNVSRSVDLFAKNRRSPDGLWQYCKGCDRERRLGGRQPKVSRHIEGFPDLKAAPRNWELTGIKACSKCKNSKTLNAFSKSGSSGLASWCKACEAAKARRLKPRKTKERLDCPTSKECRKCSMVLPREDFHNNRRSPDGKGIYCKPCQRAAGRAVYLKNGKAHMAARAQVIAADPTLRMNLRILGLVRKALERRNLKDRGSSVTGSFWSAVGYTKSELARHIEGQFTDGMAWGNARDWHIDHILPVRSFTFSSFDDSEFKACWALSNLRPLWAKDNLEKQDRMLFLI